MKIEIEIDETKFLTVDDCDYLGYSYGLNNGTYVFEVLAHEGSLKKIYCCGYGTNFYRQLLIQSKLRKVENE